MLKGLLVAVAAVTALSLSSGAVAQKTNDVRVINAATQPVPVRDVGERGRVPFQMVVSFTLPSATACPGANVCLVPIDTVPAMKRLVIEHIGIYVMTNGTLGPYFVAFGSSTAFAAGNVAIVKPDFASFTEMIPGYTVWTMDRPVLVYYETGTEVKVKIWSAANFSEGTVTVHGYLVDL